MKIFRRSTLVILLNQTNEELCLEKQSLWLQGVWTADKKPSLSILAGESGLWQSESISAGKSTGGDITYQIVGASPEQLVSISWRNPFLGRSSYRRSVRPKGFELEVQGGRGMHGTVVFIFRNAVRDLT